MNRIRGFRAQVIIRVAALIAGILTLAYWGGPEHWPLLKIALVLALIGLTIELIRYVERTNRDLKQFLLALKHKDFTHHFAQNHTGRSFAELREAFNEIIRSFQNLRAEKESHYQYLLTVIEHVQVALICYSADGQIELMNQAAKDLLQRRYLSNLSGLERDYANLLQAMQGLNSGQRQLLKTQIGDELRSIALAATEFKLQGKAYQLVSLQDIRSELDEREIETWQKLIRVLTHEIMNSVTPIVSLSKVVSGMLQDERGTRRPLAEVDEEDAEDILQSVQTIESRSKGLLHFVNAYRNLTKVQKPHFQPVRVQQLLDRVQQLLSPELARKEISLHLPEDCSLTFAGDVQLIEQVVINLIKNAMEALNGQPDPWIRIEAGTNNDTRPYLRVRDNGPGIDAEYRDKIFIPFFTTKKKGSGIGLSLSRQIMRLHGGSIHLQQHAEGGTSFILVF